MPASKSEFAPTGREGFLTTHWSLVVKAGGSKSVDGQRALTTLCENYWYPLYAFVRRKGHHADEAQELTQAFFTQLLATDSLKLADRERGKFRSFLLGAMQHFLAKEWRRAKALKRGG